ncbi:hypothetical protein N431DRAFT_485597 [Stipitochalara longipes BDJ]|nr:hypothetical protein N431DRAFT_485597 [Stipitochalara longipes BDJ]
MSTAGPAYATPNQDGRSIQQGRKGSGSKKPPMSAAGYESQEPEYGYGGSNDGISSGRNHDEDSIRAGGGAGGGGGKRFCSKCGRPVSANARYCSNCGFPKK